MHNAPILSREKLESSSDQSKLIHLTIRLLYGQKVKRPKLNGEKTKYPKINLQSFLLYFVLVSAALFPVAFTVLFLVFFPWWWAFLTCKRSPAVRNALWMRVLQERVDRVVISFCNYILQNPNLNPRLLLLRRVAPKNPWSLSLGASRRRLEISRLRIRKSFQIS